MLSRLLLHLQGFVGMGHPGALGARDLCTGSDAISVRALPTQHLHLAYQLVIEAQEQARF